MISDRQREAMRLHVKKMNEKGAVNPNAISDAASYVQRTRNMFALENNEISSNEFDDLEKSRIQEKEKSRRKHNIKGSVMDKFPDCFIGAVLAEKNFEGCGGFEDIAFHQLEALKDEFCDSINTNKEYVVFMESELTDHDGDFDLCMRAKTFVVPTFSEAQLAVLKIVNKKKVVEYASLKQASTDALIRMGVFILDVDTNSVRINSTIKHHFEFIKFD